MNVVEINGLKKKFEDFKLDIPALKIHKGFITGFIGENGAGKTTTIKLIMNMLFPDEGNINIFDKELKTNNKYIKENIGYVGEACGFIKELKLKNIKKSICPFYKNWDDNLYNKYIKDFSLNENKKYSELSHGKKKQFDLTMALSHHPKFIILDEPTANLDPIVRNKFLDILLEQMQDEEISVFYSSHITTDLEKAADYIIFIHNGKIILNKEKDKLLESHCIIKGKIEFLTNETKTCFINVNEKNSTFEGLCNNKSIAYDFFGNEVIYDKVSLEDIMTFYIKR